MCIVIIEDSKWAKKREKDEYKKSSVYKNGTKTRENSLEEVTEKEL